MKKLFLKSRKFKLIEIKSLRKKNLSPKLMSPTKLKLKFNRFIPKKIKLCLSVIHLKNLSKFLTSWKKLFKELFLCLKFMKSPNISMIFKNKPTLVLLSMLTLPNMKPNTKSFMEI